MPRPGSQTDVHGCVQDGGYEWCESTQQCQRPWISSCEDSWETDFCTTSNVQMCRMACSEPSCPHPSQCAMRIGNCCDYMCSTIQQSDPVCPKTCPPPVPCPAPPMDASCRVVPAVVDHCGCISGCPSIDCSHIVTSGETCGGYTFDMTGVCDDGLECVYTMGPMIADAPGTCMPICSGIRDQYGNCVKENTEPQIPYNCVTWYDGCNTCSVNLGELQGCTMMMCFTQNEPYCQVFTRGDLHLGDICYRFCEDGSQNPINRGKDCPIGTVCGASDPSIVSYDSCGVRAHTCNLITGH